MKRRVVVLDLHKEILDGDFCVELFVNLAHDCLIGGFSLFDLATGEFPAAFEFSIASLRCKDFAIFHDNGSYNVDCFHWVMLLKWI